MRANEEGAEFTRFGRSIHGYEGFLTEKVRVFGWAAILSAWAQKTCPHHDANRKLTAQ